MSQTSAANGDVYFWDATAANNAWSVRPSYPKLQSLFIMASPEPRREKKPSKWLQKQIKRCGKR